MGLGDYLKPIVSLGAAALGWEIAGPVGGAIGWSLGMGIGGALFPPEAEKTTAMSLGPAQLFKASSDYGGIIPVLRGCRRTGGNMIWHIDPVLVTSAAQVLDYTSFLAAILVKENSDTPPTEMYAATFAYGVCHGIAHTLKVYEGKNEYLIIGNHGYLLNEGQNVPPEYREATYDEQVALVTAKGIQPSFRCTQYAGDQVFADPKIVEANGINVVPPYRNLHYIVFMDFPMLTNDIPQLSFETTRMECADQPAVINTYGDALGFSFESYIELINGTIAEVIWYSDSHGSMDYMLSRASFTTIDFSIYNGSPVYEFEVIANNAKTFDVTLQVIDGDDEVCAEVVIPAETWGTTGCELYRFREDFTPTSSTTYGLRLEKPGGGAEYDIDYDEMYITQARIIVRQTMATSSRIQIPLFGYSYNYNFQSGDYEPYDCPFGIPILQNLSYNEVGFADAGGDIYTAASVWRYDSTEIATISEATFSVMAIGPEYREPYVNAPHQHIYTTDDIESFILALYWSTSDASMAYASPTSGWVGEDNSFTDTGGRTFYPISGTMADCGSYPCTDFELTGDPETGHTGTVYLYVGGVINTYLDGQMTQFGRLARIGSLGSGDVIDDITVHVDSTGAREITITLEYVVIPAAEPQPISVALFNITTSSVVSGSTLTWQPNEFWNRKNATVTLTANCDYRFGVYNPINYNPSYYFDAELLDAQLLLEVTPISAMTTWQRCLHSFAEYWDNYNIPDAWGDDFWDDPWAGATSIGARAVAYLPTGHNSQVYFEATMCSLEDEPWGEESQEEYMKVFLEDLGTGEGASSGEDGVDVESSMMWWGDDDSTYFYRPVRKRTAEITDDLVNGHEYANRQPGSGQYYGGVFSNGFLVYRIGSG